MSADVSEHRLRIGGVMRCCIATLEKRALNGYSPDEGETLPCDYCSSGLIYDGGAWRWWRERRDSRSHEPPA